MIRFLDGPAKGVVLALRAAPQRLRVVQAPRWTWDALDQPGDQPRPGETVFWYERHGPVEGYACVDGYDPKRRRKFGFTTAKAEYLHERHRLTKGG